MISSAKSPAVARRGSGLGKNGKFFSPYNTTVLLTFQPCFYYCPGAAILGDIFFGMLLGVSVAFLIGGGR